MTEKLWQCSVLAVSFLVCMVCMQPVQAASFKDQSTPLNVQGSPIVLAQASTAAASQQPDFILNKCQETQSTGFSISAVRGIDPGYALANALNNVAGKDVVSDLSAIKNITLLEGTKHGEILTRTASDGRTTFRYNPIPNYVGGDRAVFMAEFEGKRYKIVVNLKVSIVVDYNSPLCPANPYQLIKVTKPSSGTTGIDTGVGNGINFGTLSVTFADLPGGAVGETVGTTITLDNTAANKGLFIDSTQALTKNGFLPQTPTNG